MSIPFAAQPDNPKKSPRPKPGWPNWPFFWMDERNMNSLQEIASRLKEKMDSAYQGLGVGETTQVENRILEIISRLQQQVVELQHDAFQASLQIIDDNRPSRRLKRAVGWISDKWHAAILRLRNSTTLTILGAVGAVVLIVEIVMYVIQHYFSRMKLPWVSSADKSSVDHIGCNS